jgi:hypothetical protein
VPGEREWPGVGFVDRVKVIVVNSSASG